MYYVVLPAPLHALMRCASLRLCHKDSEEAFQEAGHRRSMCLQQLTRKAREAVRKAVEEPSKGEQTARPWVIMIS